MSVLVEPDVHAAAAHLNMAAHVAGPLRAGARDVAVELDGERADVARRTRQPLLLAAPVGGPRDVGLRLEARLDPDGVASALPPLEFAAGTEPRAFLPLLRPPLDAGTEFAAPFSLALSVLLVPESGAPTPVPAAELDEHVELRLLEGILGRVLYVLGAEKLRMRRVAREIGAARRLVTARGDALDRHGVDLEVPRFREQLVAEGDGVGLTPRREPDVEYRRRLLLYRPWRWATRSRLLALLNGEGDEAQPNTGPLGEMGVPQRFFLHDRGNELSLACKIVGAPDDAARTRFLDYLRDVHLVWPQATARSDQVHARRFVPAGDREQTERLRARLRARFSFGAEAAADPALAPELAAALARLGACLGALNAPPRALLRAQAADGGSRYELGVGADLEPFTAAELDELGERVLAPPDPTGDRETDALVAGLRPGAPSEDPIGRWLLGPCGLVTAHPARGGRLYVSTLPTGGLVLDGPTSAAVGARAELRARQHAHGDPGPDAVLADGLAGALAERTGSGGAAWTVLTADQAATRCRAAPAQAADAPALAVFRGAGLPAVQEPAQLAERLEAIPDELLAALMLAPGQSQSILAGDAGADDDLRRLVDALRRHWLVAALPLVVSSTEVMLAVSVTGLPEAGTNLVRRRVIGVRWSVEPIAGPAGEIARLGPRTGYTPREAGVAAVVALGYARRERTDPYEYRVELGGGGRLGLLQYEYLMNLLEHTHPLGLVVDTAGIRDDQVDFTGSGAPVALSAAQSRMFRPNRPRRGRIAGDIFGPDTPGFQLAVHATIGIDTLLKPPRDIT